MTDLGLSGLTIQTTGKIKNLSAHHGGFNDAIFRKIYAAHQQFCGECYCL